MNSSQLNPGRRRVLQAPLFFLLVGLILGGCGAATTSKSSSTGETAAARSAGDPIAGMLLHVRDLLDAGQADSAIAVLRPRLIAGAPMDARLIRAMVITYGAAGLQRDGMRILDDLILFRSSDANLHVARGEIELQRHRPEVALRHFQRAIVIDDTSPEVTGGFGRCRALTGGSIDPALALFDKIITARPTSAAARYGKAVLLLESGRVEEAAADLRWVIGLNEGLWQAERDYGRALVRLSNRQGAIEHFEKAVRLLDGAGDPIMAEQVAGELREAAEGAGDGSPPGGGENPPAEKDEPQG